MKRIITNYTGVYERKSNERKQNGKLDICFDIAYRFDGKLIWEKVGWSSEGYTAKLANEIRSERLRSIRHGHELPRQKKKAPYMKDVAKKYFQWAEVNKAQKGKDDQHRYRNHFVRFTDKRLSEISSFDLERWKADLIKKKYAPATVKHCLVLFRQIINKAILWGMYKGENPIKGVKMPTVQNERQRFLNYDEANLLLNELQKISQQLHDMSLLSLHTGLRAGEIFSLKGQNIDFENRLITITETKNKTSRKAFMSGKVKKMLANYIPESPDGYVFKTNQGKKITEISKSFGKAVITLKLNKGVKDRRQRVVFHSLRHSFASWLALQGETLLTIKELLGHKTLAMTLRYSHLIPDQKRAATLKLEKAFNTEKMNKKPEVRHISHA